MSASGKTTLAQALSERLGVPHVELDALHWEPNWTSATPERFRQRVAEALAGDTWVVDGNYSAVRDLVWDRANVLVWLDYPLPVILYRLVKRTVRRVGTREELWNGNREDLKLHLSRDGLLYWVLTTYRRKRAQTPMLLQKPEYAHLSVYRFRFPKDAQRWLSCIPFPVADRPGKRVAP
ncbi:MAG: adenylate kinase [Armatimonadetes bacterium]|nr:adenylate kinase [Armatimonadota bacterium]